MEAGHIKGGLLEYIIRNLLKNCGFTNVKADGLYTFERGGLFFINGKGAAHDADVIMNPPIQMPFTYPSQIIFECKAYGTTANLPVVRNALGLRTDINDFEIVTKSSLRKRQNNRRAAYAIETRKRFLYQVGVASVNDFSKPAIEFASNNKIPLLSLNWFLSAGIIENFNSIDQPLIDHFNQNDINNLYTFLKDRNGNLYTPQYEPALRLLRSDNILGDIVTFANTTINYSYIGLLETGDMVFLFARTRSEDNILNQLKGLTGLKAEIYWNPNRPNVWRLIVFNAQQIDQRTEFDFFVPKRIFQYWEQFNLTRVMALNIKREFFSKIFVFNNRNNLEMPFSIINIDQEWLNHAIEALL